MNKYTDEVVDFCCERAINPVRSVCSLSAVKPLPFEHFPRQSNQIYASIPADNELMK